MWKTLFKPVRIVTLAFLAAIAVGTLALMLPVMTVDGEGAPFLTALFIATSAICVTGLSTVDTPNFWSTGGMVTILILIKLGGLGIMTVATLLGLLAGRGMSLSTRAITHAERGRMQGDDARAVLKLVIKISFALEALVALFLWPRFALGYDMGWGEAAWTAVFHSVSAFNNAGFSTFSDSLIGFAHDGFILIPIMAAIIVGGIGFPVLHEMKGRWSRPSPRPWTLHSKLTLATTAGLLLGGFALMLATEWHGVLGGMNVPAKALNAAFHSVSLRTAGFNAVDMTGFSDSALLFQYGMMLIGGGSAGTAGGIKVTTFALLGYVVWSEMRGDNDTNIMGRRVGHGVIRQALSVVLIALAIITAATMLLSTLEAIEVKHLAYEAISAFATVGLSTGITAQLSAPSQIIIIVLMFIGRIGSISFATALALRASRHQYRLPQEQPIVG
jgi:trk system potassium uptake protein